MKIVERLKAAVDGLRGRGPLTAEATDLTADTPENMKAWQSIRDGERDLPQAEYDKAIRNLHRLYERDGYATRICGYVDEYCIGPGVKLRSTLKAPAPAAPPAPGAAPAAPDAKTAALVEKHEELLRRVWKEKQTRWDELQHEMPRMFFLLAEQLYVAFTNKVTGMTAWGYVDPGQIDRVVMDPLNRRSYLGVLLKAGAGQTPIFLPFHARVGETDEKGNPVLPEEGETFEVPKDPTEASGAPRTKARVGKPCFYYAFNKAPSARRGLSPLYRVIDEMWGLDRVHFGAIEAAKVRSAFCWHATVETSDEKELKKVTKEVKETVGRRSGAVLVTSPNVVLEAKAPVLGATEQEIAERNFRRAIFGKLGLPETWFADASSTGDSSTTELSAPALKMLGGVQAIAARAIRDMVDYALVKLAEVEASELLATEEEIRQGKDHPVLSYDLGLPEIGGRDSAREMQGLVQYTTTLDLAVGRKFVTPRKASELWQAQVRGVMGVQFAPEDTPEDVDLGEDRLVELQSKLDALDKAAAGPSRKGDPGGTGDAIARAREGVLRELGVDYDRMRGRRG